jgi:D-xylose transport system substrate-binding protein
MRLRTLAFLCLAFPLFFTGWGHWGPPVKVGLSLDRLQGKEALVERLKAEMGENRGGLLVKDAGDDPATQEAEVKEMIQQGIQALVVIPCSPSKAAPLVEAAHQAGIKVISLERLMPGSGLDYLIAFNGEMAGQLQAQALVKKVPKGRYVLLGGSPLDGFSRDIRKGQMKILQPFIDRGDLRIVASRGGKAPKNPSGASKESGAILILEGDKVDAVLATDNETAQGAVKVLEKAGLSGKVPVAGVGEDLPACRRIASGTQTLTVYLPPQKLAEETAYLAAKLARKAKQFDCQFTEVDNGEKKIQAVLLTPLVVDARNLDSTVIKDKLQKKEDVYGK